MSMAKHLQQHNIWPVSYATVLSIACFIFWGGVFYNQTSQLRSDLNDFKVQYKEDRKELQAEINDLKRVSLQSMVVKDNSGRVLGVATHSATLEVPSATPTATRVAPTPTP